ncbi:hypothetical protein B4U80_08014 [Leptotrombidium deliense]|uniref:CUB domain-containing protein n=1 Tax=Leptotrombidium deliense TaxID=299467 RepID=A0A443SH13_9ACAR|nr:hypothetical protein B4U80_08014 [Leptotrombidium deliense]
MLLQLCIFLFGANCFDPNAQDVDVGTLYYPVGLEPEISIKGRYNPTSTKECGGLINTAEGWIFSPHYPANYENSISCTYIIERFSLDVCKVELHFIDFDLEDTQPNCDADYLDLGQGYRMCGIILPDTQKTIQFLPSQTSLQFKFRSNEDRNRKGFMARVKQIPNSCTGGPITPIYPNDSPHVDNSINTFQHNCDVYITGFGGTIRSPDFPRNYASNRLCLYVFKRPANNVCRVELTLNKFDVDRNLYSGSTDCEGDYLELPDRTKLCGYRNDRRTIYYPTGSDYMVLTFKSDSVGGSAGFDIDVRQIPNSCDFLHVPKFYKCDYKIEGETTRIQSPGFPNFYGSKDQCVYFVQKLGYDTCYFTMDFIRFNLESSSKRDGHCSKDFLQLPDGTRICGNVSGKRTFVFPREADRFPMFYFSSDEFAEGRGYDIIIRQLPCGVSPTPWSPPFTQPPINNGGLPCDRVIYGDETITSPDYPRDYRPLTRCIYTIYKSHTDVCEVRLQFISFDVEKTTMCRADYFLIEPTAEKLCGRDLKSSERVIKFGYDSRNIRLIFASDAQVQRPGYELKITQMRNSCQRPIVPLPDQSKLRTCETTSLPEAIFRSYNYPMPYSPNIECLYKVYRANKNVCAVQLYFSDFSVGTWESRFCVNDFVEIDATKYCGVRRGERLLVSFPHYLNSLDIRFKTDGYENYGGFRIEMKQISDNCNSAPKAKGGNCDERITQSTFTVSSPNYGIKNYDDFTDCHYTVKKSSYNVCALEVTYKRFDVEESVDCIKDYFEISGVKLCGKLPFDSKRTYEFAEDEMVLKFHADADTSSSGFFANIRQVPC